MGYALYRYYETREAAEKQAKKFKNKGLKTKIQRMKKKPSAFKPAKIYYGLMVQS